MFRLFQQQPNWQANLDHHINGYAQELRDKWENALDETAPGIYLQLGFLLGKDMLYDFIATSLKKEPNRTRILEEIEQVTAYEVKRIFHGVFLHHLAFISHQTTKRSIGEDVFSLIEHELSNEEKKWFSTMLAQPESIGEDTARYVLKMVGYGESADRSQHISLFVTKMEQVILQIKKGFDSMLDDFDLRDRYYEN